MKKPVFCHPLSSRVVLFVCNRPGVKTAEKKRKEMDKGKVVNRKDMNGKEWQLKRMRKRTVKPRQEM